MKDRPIIAHCKFCGRGFKNIMSWIEHEKVCPKKRVIEQSASLRKIYESDI